MQVNLHVWCGTGEKLKITSKVYLLLLNRVQYEIIKLIANPRNNIFVVGDDDQSIYRFRGSRPEFLLNFKNDFPNAKEIVLDINYRSTDNIIKFSNMIIANNKKRYEKDIIGTNILGKNPIIIKSSDIQEEALYIANKIENLHKKIPLNEIAVLYRTNIQSRSFIDTFMDLRIPFQIKDEAPGIYESWISKDIYCYFKLALDRSDNKSLERIINKPKRYVSKVSLKECKKYKGILLDNIYEASKAQTWIITKIEELISHLNIIKNKTAHDAIKYLRHDIGYDDYIKEYAIFRNMTNKGMFETLDELEEAARGHKSIDEYIIHVDNVIEKIKSDREAKRNFTTLEDSVTFSTIHGVKGLEYDTVFVTSVNDGIIPYEKSKTPMEIEEECRLLYVAITRAKNSIYLSVLKNKYGISCKKSRFLKNIEI